MHPILKELSGSDRRSIGKSNQVVKLVLRDTALFDIVFNGMFESDPVLRMRCADAVEKITARNPGLLQPHKKELICHLAHSEQQEVRWHVAQMFSRLKLTPRERYAVIEILDDYLTDKSSIVKTFAMQALADLAAQDENLRETIVKQLEELTCTGTPAMKNRGRKLVAELSGDS